MGQVAKLVPALITNIKLDIIVTRCNLTSRLLQAPNLTGLEEGIGHTNSQTNGGCNPEGEDNIVVDFLLTGLQVLNRLAQANKAGRKLGAVTSLAIEWQIDGGQTGDFPLIWTIGHTQWQVLPLANGPQLAICQIGPVLLAIGWVDDAPIGQVDLNGDIVRSQQLVHLLNILTGEVIADNVATVIQ